MEEALTAADKFDPVPKLQKGWGSVLLAHGLLEERRRERAEKVAREGHDILKSILRADHWMLDVSDIVLAGALIRGGKGQEGKLLLMPVVARNDAKKSKGWWAEVARKYARELN